MRKLKKKWLNKMVRLTPFLLFLFLLAPKAQAEPMCPVYSYTCLPEVNHVSIEKHHMPCWKSPYFEEGEAMRALADKGIYMPWPEVYGKEELIHTCEINGREIKIKMFAEHFPAENNIVCWEQYKHMMRTTWWLDDVKVVNNVGFIKNCVPYDGMIGNYLESISAEVYYQSDKRADISLEAEVADYSADAYATTRFFSIRITPPYDTTSYMTAPPITNDDIH